MKKTATRSILTSFLFTLMTVIVQHVYAQVTVAGKVYDETGETMPGVNVLVKNSSKGTTTDVDGKFTVEVPGPDAVLVFSFIGYEQQELPVGDQTQLEVRLKFDIHSLDEVVVIGYGTQRRQDVTTAVAKVTPQEFVPGAVRNAGELLRGKVAGLTISTSSGDPEAEPDILLRGITSIFGSSAPLVLIDGNSGDLNTISPSDIESVEVLKDASAAAIYGTRGKNGVILISTKKAKGDTVPVVEYAGYVSTERFQKTADFMDAGDVRKQISAGNITDAYDLGGNTDWLKEITRKPFNNFHNISLRGGTGRTKYVANASYQMAEGIFLKSENEEFKIRMDLDHYLIQDKLKLNVNVLKGLQNYGGFNGGIYRQALIRNPTDNVKNADGTWVEHPDQFQYENPVALLKEETNDNQAEWTWLTGSLSYFPIDGLELKIAGSQHNWGRDIGTYQTRNHISTVRDGRNGWAYVSNENTKENFLDLTADYSKISGKHRISGLAGYSYIDYAYSHYTITNFNFPTDKFSYHAIDQGRALREGKAGAGINIDKPSTDNWPNDWRLVAFLGRVGYGYDDRYNILASVRYEGSSRFGANNKWGVFPAVSAGWTMSNEAFLKSVSVIDNLKLRVGYGRTGSIGVNPYGSLTRYRYSATQFYFNGTDWVSILSPVANANPNLGWETNTEYNIGLDFGILNRRLSGTIDYYDRTLEDLVYDYPVPQPPNLVGTTRANAASFKNKGVEVTLNFSVVKTGKFEWNTNLNYSRNTNTLRSLSSGAFQLENNFFYAGGTGDPIQMVTHKLEKGKALGSFFGYKSVGLNEDGVWLIEDVNGETIPITEATEDDRKILGNALPKSYMAWNNYFRYGNFDLNITMRGAFGYQILNFQRMFYENPTIAYNKLRSAYDLIDGKMLDYGQAYVSHYIEDGDFWKIDNVTLGYNLKSAAKLAVFKAARVYASASNLATITGYKGLDPEVRRTGLDPGNDDRDKYPTVRAFTLGVNLTF